MLKQKKKAPEALGLFGNTGAGVSAAVFPLTPADYEKFQKLVLFRTESESKLQISSETPGCQQICLTSCGLESETLFPVNSFAYYSVPQNYFCHCKMVTET